MLLKASAKRLFETLMEQTADRIYIKDRQSRFITVSKALALMHGFKDRHELEGLTDFDLFSEEHAKQAFEDERAILETGKPIINKVEKETWDDGHVTWVSTSKAPLHLSSQQYAGIIGISRDITAEHIAQQQREESEEKLRQQNEIMRSDYESAHKVQSVMIPGRVPQVKHIELAYLWKPMTSVGGDLVNFPRNPNGCLLFYLGDVCGHGVTAAFYTVLLKYLTAHEAETYNSDPTDFLDRVNKEITGRLSSGFVTGMAGHFGRREKDGSRILHLANCGHPLNLVYRKKTHSIESIHLPTGMVMGFPGSSASPTTDIELQQGDRFYTYTDGIIEASNPEGEEFGRAGLERCLVKHADKPLQETLDILYKEVADFTREPTQQDDITLLAFELT
ncbi:PP2C family protein-serine/threonine phosphatase [Coraliomargarita akajimensis]|uniref:Putative PAS/PAC sensor protein n=1 Tax=Coraliomargarita akajimensis (strain DSM 45221 / IAM 15411 / JCM 23193 / KCTC 12865 / 04OKA010-24) TaxID=583355 RepID=D5EIG4_CORAD|nr:SpoIIE family protein phosphatase [Coraliomargarita akajimensis]ADE54230.1 putative PAS/PAC sensor protein [Coraliomargarita akajimensis DSM 45221]